MDEITGPLLNEITMANLDITDVRPFIGAIDFDVSRDFYVTLGWKVIYDSPELRVMELGSHRFYLQKYYVKAWCDNLMLHVSVEDVDAWFDFVKAAFADKRLAAPARFSGEPKDMGYARVFHVWDPAGVLLHFAQFP